jgi:hypothetical protein
MGRCQWDTIVAEHRLNRSRLAIFFQEYLAKDFGSQDAINGYATAEPHL